MNFLIKLLLLVAIGMILQFTALEEAESLLNEFIERMSR